MGGAWTPAACAEYLRAAADLLRRRRFEIAAWEILECGKQWREADADVCEAIDFCEYYAAGAIALDEPQEVDVPGEENRFIHVPRGVTAVISPWNFPLAILTGMTAAALATGNTVVMKPAEQSSITAAKLMEVFQEVELPAGVANFLPGRGEIVGAGLVDHPDVPLIVFTGSRAVGLAINKRAAEVSAAGLPYVKRVIAEMGGKNAIIVDEDADLDEAVLGVVKSAFGYQGQKCSACSRAIVLDRVYDAFVARLIEATRSLKVGPADDPATSVGPVIDRESVERIQRYIELGRKEGREAAGHRCRRALEKGKLHWTAHLCRREIHQPAGAGGDLWPRGRGDSREGPDRGDRNRQRHRVCTHRRYLFAKSGQPRSCSAGDASGKPISQPLDYRRLWSAGSRSAGTRCRALAAKPADRITCCSL